MRIESATGNEELIFEVDKVIGTGAFGSVMLCKNRAGERFAVKKINKQKCQKVNIAHEVNAGLLLDHPKIVKFLKHYQDADNEYLAFEYLKGCDLFNFFERRGFKPFYDREAKGIMRQLVHAIQYCHTKGVVHFDIKLDNIMINPTDATVKIIDFGLCDFITPEQGDCFNKRCGSEEYVAPEVLEGKRSFSGTKIDVWCLGVVMYSLLSATFPFDAQKRKKVVHLGGKHPQPIYNFAISAEAKDLISKMLENDPAQRITLDAVAAHPWFLKP